MAGKPEAGRPIRMARDDTGLGESDSDESNEKWSKSGCIFEIETSEISC